MEFLETAVREWDRCLPPQASLFVTVDGSPQDTQRVARVVDEFTGSVFQVGQSLSKVHGTREGVAVNKNTGLELLMDNTGVEHLFLADDDMWPLYPQSIHKHTDLPLAHSMVCWGASRLIKKDGPYATWKWPRGVMLYATRAVVETVGGMDERFGPGGHEHVEWSNRIHNAHLTPHPFMTPASYAERGLAGSAMRAGALWHCEDMRRPGEDVGRMQRRKASLTSINRSERDWDAINAIMGEMEGASHFVPYRAAENGRASATLCTNLTSQGADK
jgi:hypothetical protein